MMSSTIDALPDEVLYLVHTTSIDPKTVEGEHGERWSDSCSAISYVNASLKSLFGAHSQLGGPGATKIFFGKYKYIEYIDIGLWIPYLVLES